MTRAKETQELSTDLELSVLNNILKNIDRNIDRQKEPPNKTARLLSMKWYLENEIA